MCLLLLLKSLIRAWAIKFSTNTSPSKILLKRLTTKTRRIRQRYPTCLFLPRCLRTARILSKALRLLPLDPRSITRCSLTTKLTILSTESNKILNTIISNRMLTWGTSSPKDICSSRCLEDKSSQTFSTLVIISSLTCLSKTFKLLSIPISNILFKRSSISKQTWSSLT